MYVIVVYDIDTKRISAVHNYLRENLYWIQNSVFEGKIRVSQFVKMKSEIKGMIKDNDSVIIYKLKRKDDIKRIVIGREKNKIKNIY